MFAHDFQYEPRVCVCVCVCVCDIYKYISNTVPTAGCGALQDCETLRIPHFLDNQHTNGAICFLITSKSRSCRFMMKNGISRN
jgi:hypothetical protein